MRSKPEAGTTLDRINWDVGVANEIFMYNAPAQNGYNTEIQRVARLEITEVQTTEPYSPWQNKSESVIKIMNGNSKRRIVQSNIPKRVWYFGMVWEEEIYSRTTGKDRRPSLEKLTGDTIDIYEWLEFELYDLVWFWNNQ